MTAVQFRIEHNLSAAEDLILGLSGDVRIYNNLIK